MVYFERRFQRRDSMFQMLDVKDGGRMLNTFFDLVGCSQESLLSMGLRFGMLVEGAQ